MSLYTNVIGEVQELAMTCAEEYLADNRGGLEEAVEKLVEAVKRAMSELCTEICGIFGEVLSEGQTERCSPVWFARELRRKEDILKLYGRKEVYRAGQFARRHYPCAHAACGVMISKGGRFVRRKKG